MTSLLKKILCFIFEKKNLRQTGAVVIHMNDMNSLHQPSDVFDRYCFKTFCYQHFMELQHAWLLNHVETPAIVVIGTALQLAQAVTKSSVIGNTSANAFRLLVQEVCIRFPHVSLTLSTYMYRTSLLHSFSLGYQCF